MRSEWVCTDKLKIVMALLTDENRLACEVSLRYGLRIGDVLALKTSDVKRGNFTIKEEKTGKSRRIKLSPELQTELLAQSGRIWVFEGRCDYKEHRTRQAVWKDLKRAAEALRLSERVTPHSMRKIYAVNAYARYGGIAAVRRLLNHSNEAVTMIYALADQCQGYPRRQRPRPLGRAGGGGGYST